MGSKSGTKAPLLGGQRDDKERAVSDESNGCVNFNKYTLAGMVADKGISNASSSSIRNLNRQYRVFGLCNVPPASSSEDYSTVADGESFTSGPTKNFSSSD